MSPLRTEQGMNGEGDIREGFEGFGSGGTSEVRALLFLGSSQMTEASINQKRL